MFKKQSRENLKWALKASLLEQSKKIQVKEARMFVKNFILKEATYEQLLNLVLNPHRDQVYLEAGKLEKVAKAVIQESLSGKNGNSKTLLESFVKEAGVQPGFLAKVGRGVATPLRAVHKAATGIRKEIGKQGKEASASAEKMGQTLGISPEQMPVFKAGAAETFNKSAEPWKKGSDALRKASGKIGGAMMRHQTATGAAALGTAALAGYLVYRKMRSSGKSNQEAAMAAANAEQNPQKKQMWLQKANQA